MDWSHRPTERKLPPENFYRGKNEVQENKRKISPGGTGLGDEGRIQETGETAAWLKTTMKRVEMDTSLYLSVSLFVCLFLRTSISLILSVSIFIMALHVETRRGCILLVSSELPMKGVR